MKFWLLKAAGTLEDEERILDDSVVTIGWAELPDLSNKNKEQVKQLILEKYPGMRGGLSETWAGEIYSFITKIRKGDLVAVPLKARNEVLIGKVTGDYEHRQLSNFISHIRNVRWLKTFPKEYFEEEYDVDFNSPEALFPIKADSEKLSGLIETKSLEALIGELSFALEDLELMKERMLELVNKLAETEEIPEVRRIAAEMEKILK
ncbi:restriction endonuclease [Methanosarcina horonobensis]|nr:hypothetical protein [Methanosarcina horonobensis]